MNNLNIQEQLISEAPSPRIRKKSGFSMVWLIPLLTALIGCWLIYKTVSEKGPRITITFKTAEGIEAGKTKIKYKDIEIGVVESVQFSDDFSQVIVHAQMEKDTDQFIRRETLFWVVKPRLTMRGATGLDTLLSGAYIEIEPGQGAMQKHFIGLDNPPVIKADVPGKKIVMLTYNLRSIDTGSPIYYQGILAGEALGWELGTDRKSIFVYGFIKSPYDKLIQSNTKFWNVSGIDVAVSAEGINIKTESIQSLLYGGIAFENPDTLEPVRDNVEELVFTLYDNYKKIREEAFTKKVQFILFFDGSVRGLNVGAPVEFKGIKVGSVLDIRLEFDARDSSFRIPVLIEIEPERFIERGGGQLLATEESLQNMIDKGLRARLQSGSLLTGQLYVDLVIDPETPIRLVGGEGVFPELPTIPAGLEQITSSVQNILTKFENVRIEEIGDELLETLEGANKLATGASELINRPELPTAINDLKESLRSFQSILNKVDQRVEPITINLENAIQEAHQALEKVQVTMDLMNQVLEYDSPLQSRFMELADELGEMARSIRIFMDLLERDPNSIIFGKSKPGEK